MKLLKKSEIVLLAIMLVGIGILTYDGLSSKSQPKNQSKMTEAKSESSKKVQKPKMTKRGRLKIEFTEDEEAMFKVMSGTDITNKVAQVLIDNDLDTLERFLEYLREKDDWRKMKAVADSLFSIPNWGSKVTEDAQDYVLDAISEYTPKTLPELLGFLESPYEDVREDALDELADSIEESENEAEMGRLIVQLSQTIEDADFAERMAEHIDMMDDANAAGDTMRGIYEKGNAVFKKALVETFGDIFETEEKVNENITKWVNEQNGEDEDE